jgi:uroporphyrinogen-III synthase
MSNMTVFKDLSAMSKELNLLYYEYDKYQNAFLVDSRYDDKTTFSDLIKLTHELSKHNIPFFKDERSNIVITMAHTFLSPFKQRIKNMKYDVNSYSKNIYLLSDKKLKYAKNLPMIETISIDTPIDLDGYEAVIFTSKNGVKHAEALLGRAWRNIPAYAISKDTAKQIKELKGKLVFTGKEKHGDAFAYELLDDLKGKKVAYLAAASVVSDLVEILTNNGVMCDYIPVYKTVCKAYDKKHSLPSGSFIIFSSPSTIECFFKNVEWDASFTAISIGHTTAKYFPDFVEPVIADTPSLKSCICKALSL